MNILVTGANGLLGTNTVSLLLEKGFTVKAMQRNTGSCLLPSHPRLQLVPADLQHAAAVEHAITGCDAVIHIAALTAQDVLSYNEYHAVNVTGTLHVINAVKKHGIARVVYVSTANTVGFGADVKDQEQQPAMFPFTVSPYVRSKQQAEAEMLSLAASGTEVVVVNPSFMLGAYDSKPGSGRIVLMGYNRRWILCPPGGKNFVHVKDVAAGIVAALEQGKSGERYLMTGENMSYRDFFERMSVLTQTSPRIIVLPCWALRTAGVFGDMLRLLKIRTALSSCNMRILCERNYYSNSKARQQLGMVFLPVEYAVNDALVWFKSKGMIR
jgi:dihydroflavonol-4-reductase